LRKEGAICKNMLDLSSRCKLCKSVVDRSFWKCRPEFTHICENIHIELTEGECLMADFNCLAKDLMY
jgi:hypothetical protein